MPSVSPVPLVRPRDQEECEPPRALGIGQPALEGPLEASTDGDVSFTLDIDEPLPEEAAEFARKQLGETPEKRESTLAELRDLIYERGDVAPHRMDDPFLLRFLRARCFSVEKAYRLMCNYYNFKDDNPGIQEGVNLDALKILGDDDIVNVLPYREQTGRRILIYKIGKWNPSKCSVEELFKASLAILELAILEPRCQALGGVCIFDLGGLSLQHAWQMTPSIADKVLQLMGGSFPIRTYAIHIVNQSWIFDTVFAIFRPLLDERMRARIHFHGSDMESLHRHVLPKHLPVAYGGVRDEYSYKHWMDTLRGNERIVREMRSLGYTTDEDAVADE